MEKEKKQIDIDLTQESATAASLRCRLLMFKRRGSEGERTRMPGNLNMLSRESGLVVSENRRSLIQPQSVCMCRAVLMSPLVLLVNETT
jgi:hypothetical protein